MLSIRPFLFLSFILLVFSCGSAPLDTGKNKIDTTVRELDDYNKPKRKKENEYFARLVAPLYNSLLLDRGFNGSILLAKNGKIVFEDYHGLLNFNTREPLSATTPTHIASTSKTFTAMVILRLMEQRKLNISDPVCKYLHSFPYKSITIKDLLTHRSGLINYSNFFENSTSVIIRRNKKGRVVKRTYITAKRNAPPSDNFVTNDGLLNYLIDKHPPLLSAPDRCFNYCNTNFALLALITERITGIPFPKYMHDSLFEPLGMKNSYIFSIKDTDKYIPSYQVNGSPYKLEKFDCIYGDKNVYTTPRDLFKWDRALYEGTFVSQSTLKTAFQPTSNERRSQHNYGMGFRLMFLPNEFVVYHNGWWHGNNVVFKRIIKDTATVIIMGNKFNPNIYAAGKLSGILTGRQDTARTIE